ncbi:hypothetical protein NECID01_1911 [Nematocida sp. AWRm77]|nr:hypothetical protein NECID01_1911 [Nematocida sp. AWRm77]
MFDRMKAGMKAKPMEKTKRQEKAKPMEKTMKKESGCRSESGSGSETPLLVFANQVSLQVLCTNILFFVEKRFSSVLVCIEYCALACLLGVVLIKKYGSSEKNTHTLPLYVLYLIGSVPVTSGVLCCVGFGGAYVLGLFCSTLSFLSEETHSRMLCAGAGLVFASQVPQGRSINGFVFSTVCSVFCIRRLRYRSLGWSLFLRVLLFIANIATACVIGPGVCALGALAVELFFNGVFPAGCLFLHQEKLKMQKTVSARLKTQAQERAL